MSVPSIPLAHAHTAAQLEALDVNGTTYYVGFTTASNRYDGFGVVEINSDLDREYDLPGDPPAGRVVAVPHVAFDWYVGRLMSGLHSIRSAGTLDDYARDACTVAIRTELAARASL
jgi:hypothetical protein